MNALLIVLLAAIVWVWIDALRARDAALQACRRLSERLGVQLLDETVALRRLRPARDRDGRVRLRRHFRFEYSESGHERRQGEAVLLGCRVESVRGDWLEGNPDRRAVAPEAARTELAAPAAGQKPELGKIVRLSDFRARRAAMRDDPGKPH